jgi:acetoin utilization deacetylase AcuC-like enzyme
MVKSCGNMSAEPERVALFTSHVCLLHDPGAGHPECPARLKAVLAGLDDLPAAQFPRSQIKPVQRDELLLVHERALVDRLLAFGEQRIHVRLDADTVLSPDSVEAALAAAGAICSAVNAVMNGEIRRAFCAVRPPGHHATKQSAMGFCLFNSVAIGAAYAFKHFALKRIAICDFDVHHGNGTQDIFANDPRLLFMSSHQASLYPGTGYEDEVGVGNIINAQLPAGSQGVAFRHVWQSRMLPALNEFAPELILISAGFDAHKLDPLAGLNLEAADFAWITHEIIGIANKHASGRVISTLEGGYSLTALAQCSRAHVLALAD